jgi:hypothetical protein
VRHVPHRRTWEARRLIDKRIPAAATLAHGLASKKLGSRSCLPLNSAFARDEPRPSPPPRRLPLRSDSDIAKRPSMADAQSNRPHRPKKEKKPHTGDKNPKAFAFSAPGKLKRQAARSTEVCQTSSYAPTSANSCRSKRNASMYRSSTVCPKKLPQSSSASSVLQVSERPPLSRA